MPAAAVHPWGTEPQAQIPIVGLACSQGKAQETKAGHIQDTFQLAKQRLYSMEEQGMAAGMPAKKGGRIVPVTMEETAAQVQTTTVFPSLSPQVCSMRPAVVSPDPARMPTGTYRMLTWLPSRNPVLQAAADSPKQAPACHQLSTHQCPIALCPKAFMTIHG